MMKRLFLSLFWCAVSWLQVSAQQKFVDKLVKPVNGQGTVRVIQDAEITRMVNGGGSGCQLHGHDELCRIRADKIDVR
jgi:hypothetical protein